MKHYVIAIFFIGILLVASSPAHAALWRNLKLGDRGADVLELQVFLNKDPETQIAISGLGSPGYETEYFGLKTQIAVKKFQSKFYTEVLAPLKLLQPTGTVGNLTRAKIAALSAAPVVPRAPAPAPVVSTPPLSVTPYIYNFSPEVITSQNQKVVIEGAGFTPTGNTIFISSESESGVGTVSSKGGKTLQFNFTFSGYEKMKEDVRLLSRNSSTSEAARAYVDAFIGEEIVLINGEKHLRVIVVVQNSNGKTNAAKLYIDLYSLLTS